MKTCWKKIAKEAMKIRNLVIDQSVDKTSIMLRQDIKVFYFIGQSGFEISRELYLMIREKIDESY